MSRALDGPDLSGIDRDGPLWNRDLAPTTPAQRTWSMYDFAALWIGLSVVITTYTLASGLMQQGMTWWQAMLTILLGNTIVLVPMLLNAHAGTQYGISFPVLCRAPFGVRGANVPALLRAFVACGWFGIQTWIGGLALDTLLSAAWPAWEGLEGSAWAAFLLFWLVQVAIIVRGTEGIRRLERFAAPLLLAGSGVLVWWAVGRGGGLGPVLSASARLQGETDAAWRLFPAGLTAAVGYWATLSLNIPDFTRYARSQRAQVVGQALGLPLTMTAFSFVGVVVTSAALVLLGEAVWDPVDLIRRIGSPAAILAGALGVLIAQISTNLAANVVAPANDFSNLAPRRIGYVTGGLITAVLGVLIMPWRLYSDAGAYIFTWLVGYSSLMGAIGGILIADYWIVRRRRLFVPDLFRNEGIYAYRRGVNPRAIVALTVAILPVVPGFLRAAVTPGGRVASPDALDHLYSYAWFVTFAISFVLYLVLMRSAPVAGTQSRVTNVASSGDVR